jgi:DNA-binding CsgD family transcriptional regulator
MMVWLRHEGFTPAEARVTEKVFEGKTNRKISEELQVSEKTVKFHLTKIFKKFKVKSRNELMAKFLGLRPISHLADIVQAERHDS